MEVEELERLLTLITTYKTGDEITSAERDFAFSTFHFSALILCALAPLREILLLLGVTRPSTACVGVEVGMTAGIFGSAGG